MRTVLIVAVGLWAASGMTQEVEPGGYIGIGLGKWDYEETILGFGNFSDSATYTKLYGGYRLNENWAFEASWETTDTVEQIATISIFPTRIGLDFEPISLRAVAFLPYSWGSFFAGLGYFDGDLEGFSELDLGATVSRLETSKSTDGATFLGGIQLDFSSLSLRLEYEWWDIDGADLDQLGVGLHWRF